MEPAELWEKVSVDAKDLLSKMLEVPSVAKINEKIKIEIKNENEK